MSKRKAEDVVEDPTVTKVPCRDTQQVGTFMPLPELDVYLATEFLPDDSQLALAMVSRYTYANFPRPWVVPALAHAMAHGYPALHDWINVSFYKPARRRGPPYDAYDHGIASIPEELVEVLLVRHTANRGERFVASADIGETYYGAYTRPVVFKRSIRTILVDTLVDLARANAPLDRVHAYWQYAESKKSIGRGPFRTETFYNVLTTGNRAHAAYHYALLHPEREDLGFALHHAALGGIDMLKCYWRDLVGYRPGDDEIRMATKKETQCVVVMFFGCYARYTNAVQQYIVKRVFGTERMYGINLDDKEVGLSVCIGRCVTKADYRMAVSVAAVGFGLQNKIDAIGALILLLAKTNDERIWGILDEVGTCDGVHMAAIASQEPLSPAQWYRLFHTWPYRYMFWPTHAMGAPPFNALNIVHWLATIPLTWIGPNVPRTSIHWAIRGVSTDVLRTVRVAPWNSKLPEHLDKQYRITVVDDTAFDTIVQRRLGKQT